MADNTNKIFVVTELNQCDYEKPVVNVIGKTKSFYKAYSMMQMRLQEELQEYYDDLPEFNGKYEDFVAYCNQQGCIDNSKYDKLGVQFDGYWFEWEIFEV